MAVLILTAPTLPRGRGTAGARPPRPPGSSRCVLESIHNESKLLHLHSVHCFLSPNGAGQNIPGPTQNGGYHYLFMETLCMYSAYKHTKYKGRGFGLVLYFRSIQRYFDTYHILLRLGFQNLHFLSCCIYEPVSPRFSIEFGTPVCTHTCVHTHT